MEALDSDLTNIETDTNAVQADLADGGRTDALIDAIKAKTDSLTFTIANQVDANMQSVDDILLAESGTGGQGFGS